MVNHLSNECVWLEATKEPPLNLYERLYEVVVPPPPSSCSLHSIIMPARSSSSDLPKVISDVYASGHIAALAQLVLEQQYSTTNPVLPAPLSQDLSEVGEHA